jgi:uncharacterized protein
MLEGLQNLLARAPGGAIVIGSDLPTLPAENILRAADLLRAGDKRTVVLGPSEDGGYHLIGIRGLAAAPLFAPMAWSTPGVCAETRRRAAAHGLTLRETGTWFDIDDGADLDRLAVPPDGARATRAAIRALRLDA